MSEEKFYFTWKVEDGYVNNGPHKATIDINDLYEDMTDEDLEDFFQRELMEDFNQKVSPVSDACDEFIAWARQKLIERGSSNE
jgi:hypothetical protein